MLSSLGGHKCCLGIHESWEEDKILVVKWDFERIPEADIYVLQVPLLEDWVRVHKRLQELGKKVVVELDDDFFNLPDYNPAKRGTNPATAKKGKANLIYLLWCVQHADAVTVTTPALRDTIQSKTSVPVYVLRNFTNKKIFRKPVYETRSWEEFRVGYQGLSTWHSGDIAELAFLGEWFQDNPEVMFVAQDRNTFETLGIPPRQRLVMDTFSFRHQRLYDHMSCMDVGLVPLVRNRFNEGKSHLKGMEYAGAGIPCIATPTESYRDWWLSGDSGGVGGAGFLAERPSEWIHALDCLAADAGLRERMGRRARLLAESNLIQDHWRLWEHAYNEILSS